MKARPLLTVLLISTLLVVSQPIAIPQARTANRLQDVPFSQLANPAWPNNTILGCINCRPIGGVCTSGGNGALAIKLNGTFYCPLFTAPIGSGTVTSVTLAVPAIFTVGGSPVTTSGTLTITEAVQGANEIYAGPVSGSDATPAFRLLVSNDIPSLDASKITSGQFPIARLASGSPTGTKFINDAGVLAVPPGGGGDFATNTSTSVDNELILFSGVSGKMGKRGTGTGVPMLTSGVVSVVSTTGSGNFVQSVSPSIITPTGIVKGDVGLGNVDNFSFATMNAAAATLSNKTINGASNTLTVREADLSLIDVTTNDVSATKHGFVPKTPADATKCLLGDGTWGACVSGAGGGDFSTTTSSSVDSELLVFSGTGGKTGKRATGTGVAIVTAGVLSTKTNPAGALVGDTDTQTLGNKTLDNTNTANLKDTLLRVQDDGDTSKQLAFQLSGITTGTTRTVTMPDASGTVTLLGNAATGSGSVVLAANPSLSSPTLTTPTIGSFTNATHTHQDAAGGGTLNTSAIGAGVLAGARGGTNNGFMDFTGPATSLKTFTLPNASATILTTNATVTVPQGGTGMTTGNSGGVPYFSDSVTLASSGTLSANRIMLGGGTGVAPATLGSLGTTVTVLHGNAAGAPSFGVVTPSDAAGNTTGSGNFVLTTSPTIATPALTLRTQANDTAIVANSPYVNTANGKLMIGNNAGSANGEVFVAGVSLVNLASNVTGDLPFANLTPATAASKLLGRGSASGAGDFEEITLGTNLSMSGTTLNATGGGGGIAGSTGATDNAILRADGVGGATLQSTGITIDDSNNIAGATSLNASGRVTAHDVYIFTGASNNDFIMNGSTTDAHTLVMGYAADADGRIKPAAVLFQNGTTDTAADTGITRNAAGVVEINNGTAGTLRDLTARNINGVTVTTTTASTGILGLMDTDATHYLNITPGSNLTAARTLTLTTGDADRTLTLTGNPSLSGITATGSGTLALGTKNLTVSNTLTLAGTDSTTMTFPATSATIARTDAANTLTNVAAPASPSAGLVTTYTDSTDLRFHDKNASGVIGTTVVADTGAANNFLTAVSAAGAISKAQPAFSNLSGTATAAQIPASLTSTTSVNGSTVPASDTLVGRATTDTLTNKRITKRTTTVASTTTSVTIDVSTTDMHITTAQAGALLYNNPTGTPTEGQQLIIRIKDNGTARALTYDTQFRASSDLALPTTTVISKTLYMGFIWNATDSKWDLLAVLNNF